MGNDQETAMLKANASHETAKPRALTGCELDTVAGGGSTPRSDNETRDSQIEPGAITVPDLSLS